MKAAMAAVMMANIPPICLKSLIYHNAILDSNSKCKFGTAPVG